MGNIYNNKFDLFYTKKNKYGNNKIKANNNMTFDSKKEYNRYLELNLLEKAKEISNLELQREFVLIPKQKGERAVTYKADFCYTDKAGNFIVEDVKSEATKKDKAYIIKRKLMLYFHNIKIHEI